MNGTTERELGFSLVSSPSSVGNFRARLLHERIDPGQALEGLQQRADGALVTFAGVVRDNSRGRRSLFLDYEGYVPMAEKELKKLACQALARFAVREIVIWHRLGRLEIGEVSVFIAVAAAHRGTAFEACRWAIDTLKRTVPIWKKEYFEDGAVWADGEAFPEEKLQISSLR